MESRGHCHISSLYIFDLFYLLYFSGPFLIILSSPKIKDRTLRAPVIVSCEVIHFSGYTNKEFKTNILTVEQSRFVPKTHFKLNCEQEVKKYNKN